MRLGFIGLGDMGLPMARRLLAAGHEVSAWNRSRDKLATLAAEGAYAAASPREVAERADLVGLCVTSDTAAQSIAFGEEGLFAARDMNGKVIADFSTGSAEAAVAFAARAAERGATWVDAPVSGGVPGAEKGILIVFAGGEMDAIRRLQPILSAVSARVSHMGPAGSGQMTKICNQMIVSCTMLVLAETIALARAAGVDVSQFAGALEGGFADSAPLRIFGHRMAAHVFEPRLGAIALMKKDAALAQALAERTASHVPMLERAIERYANPAINLEADLSQLITLYEAYNP